MADTICMGEPLINFVPGAAGTNLLTASAFHKAPDETPANVAIGLARSGVESCPVGARAAVRTVPAHQRRRRAGDNPARVHPRLAEPC